VKARLVERLAFAARRTLQFHNRAQDRHPDQRPLRIATVEHFVPTLRSDERGGVPMFLDEDRGRSERVSRGSGRRS